MDSATGLATIHSLAPALRLPSSNQGVNAPYRKVQVSESMRRGPDGGEDRNSQEVTLSLKVPRWSVANRPWDCELLGLKAQASMGCGEMAA